MERLHYKPYVPENTDIREFTVRALTLGLIMCVVLGAANAYLGLRAGMTIAATYPAAVVSMAVLRLFRGSILEENFARTVGSIGESIAAGAIFTIPAFVIAKIWPELGKPQYIVSIVIMILGGLIGIMFVAVLRRVMVEDVDLPFPESVAAAEIHKAGRSGNGGAGILIKSMVLGASIMLLGKMQLFLINWEKFFSFSKSAVSLFTDKRNLITKLQGGGGTVVGSPAISPAYIGVGYIIGPTLAAINFSGGLLAWGLFVPLLLYLVGPSIETFVGATTDGVDMAAVSWTTLAYSTWSNMVRPIAIGGMLLSAAHTLYCMRKSLWEGIRRSIIDVKKATKEKAVTSRLEKDLNFKLIAVVLLVAFILATMLYYYFCGVLHGAIIAGVVMAIAGFFFAAVSGYLVGMIGSSNNPVSGLTISTLIIAALLMVAVGVKGMTGVAAVLGVAAVTCVSCCVAGEMLQDLKAGHILGGTPWKMQTGDIIGVIVAGLVMFFPLLILHHGDIAAGGLGFGGRAFPAPQASLMAMLSQGIVAGEMAWPLIIVGMVMALGLVLIKVRSPMLVCVGMYLPFETVAAIFVGGLIRGVVDWFALRRKYNEGQRARVENTGILISSGLIAGEALMGLVIAGMMISRATREFIDSLIIFNEPLYTVGLIVLAVLAFVLIHYPLKKGA